MFRENSENIWRVPKWREEQAPASHIWGALATHKGPPRCPAPGTSKPIPPWEVGTGQEPAQKSDFFTCFQSAVLTKANCASSRPLCHASVSKGPPSPLGSRTPLTPGAP